MAHWSWFVYAIRYLRACRCKHCTLLRCNTKENLAKVQQQRAVLDIRRIYSASLLYLVLALLAFNLDELECCLSQVNSVDIQYERSSAPWRTKFLWWSVAKIGNSALPSNQLAC